jgi:glutamyl-tRNA synthetase
MNKQVRVRFAPSPTGPLHIGGVRTALYNYLYAKKHDGTFLLRIEDTDQNRFVEGAESYIKETFRWLGIDPDEGIGSGGDLGPYRQSERKEIYLEYGRQLLNEGKAYYAFDTTEELEAMRQRLKEAKADNLVYDSTSRQTMRNSLTLSDAEVDRLINDGHPFVVRMKVNSGQEVQLTDLVRAEVKVSSTNIDDKVLIKSDGMPTYHLANVVDDHLMKITHVIRGEEWLPSAPLHALLYQYLGWEATMPQFAHLPLLLKPDGNGKLSKRDADRHGYPVFPLDWEDQQSGDIWPGFREQGYLPEAITNFLALLGWNPGTEQEIFTIEELISTFSIDRINKAGARFDVEKAKWFNQQYLKKVANEVLAEQFLQRLQSEGVDCSMQKAAAICGLLKERVTFAYEFWEAGKYFFFAPTNYDEKVIGKRWSDDVAAVLAEFRDTLKDVSTLNADLASETLKMVLEKNNIGAGKVMQLLRVVLTGVAGGPDLMGIIAVLDKDEVVKRIDTALQKFN